MNKIDTSCSPGCVACSLLSLGNPDKLIRTVKVLLYIDNYHFTMSILDEPSVALYSPQEKQFTIIL